LSGISRDYAILESNSGLTNEDTLKTRNVCDKIVAQ